MTSDHEEKPGSLRRQFHRREDEIMLLQERLLAVEYELEDRLSNLDDQYADRDGIPKSEEALSRVHRREIELIKELLRGEGGEPLEKILARRLQAEQRKTAERAAELRSGGSHSESYWRHHLEGEVLSDLLRRWWEWLRGPG